MKNATDQTLYNEQFYANRKAISMRSAEIVLPVILDLFKPRKIVDVGCGTGTWLAASKRLGASEIVGLDGEMVPEPLLDISKEEFIRHDLRERLPALGTFDLAICLEVAEHLPAERAESLIVDLTERSDVILFSAAIPLQIGTGHINCQWQTYWRDIFKEAGYSRLNVIQNLFWSNKDINVVYRQNAAIYIRDSKVYSDPLSEMPTLSECPIDVVHPELYLIYMASYIRKLNEKSVS